MTVWDTPQNAIQRALELMRRERVRQQNNMAQRQAFAQNTMQGFANRPDVAAHRLATEQEFAQKGYLGETASGHLQPGPPQYAEHRGLLGGAIRNLTTPVIGGDPTGLSSPVGFLTGAVGAGLAPLSASAFGLAGGTAGAIGGGEAAQRLGIPRPIGELAGGLAATGLLALYLRSEKRLAWRGISLPLFSFVLLLAGVLASIAAVVFWLLPDGPIEPRVPLTVFGLFC